MNGLTPRDSQLEADHIALVPDHDEIDWSASTLAQLILDYGTLSFDVDDARWMVRHGPKASWYNRGDGLAALRFEVDVKNPTLRRGSERPYVKVGELLYRVTNRIYAGDTDILSLRLVNLCAPIEEMAIEADELWMRNLFLDDDGVPLPCP